jgi:hypothetical protein
MISRRRVILRWNPLPTVASIPVVNGASVASIVIARHETPGPSVAPRSSGSTAITLRGSLTSAKVKRSERALSYI